MAKYSQEYIEGRKELLDEAIQNIQRSVDPDVGKTDEVYALAYAGMLRLEALFGIGSQAKSPINSIYDWLRGIGQPSPKPKDVLLKETYQHLRSLTLPHPEKELDFYESKYNRYRLPESSGYTEDGKFYLEAYRRDVYLSIAIFRLMDDGLARSWPREGAFRLFDNFTDALRAKRDILMDAKIKLGIDLDKVEEQLGNLSEVII